MYSKNLLSGHPFYYQKYDDENTKSIFSNVTLKINLFIQKVHVQGQP